MLRLADALDVFDDMAAPVLDHPARARLAREAAFERELERLLAFVVDVGETDQVGHHFARRIVTAKFALQENSGHVHFDDFRGLLGRKLALR